MSKSDYQYHKLSDINIESRKQDSHHDQSSNLDSGSDESNQGSTRSLSKRQKLFITCFVGISLLVVVVVSVAMTQGSGKYDIRLDVLSPFCIV